MKRLCNLIITMTLVLGSCNNKKASQESTTKKHFKDCFPDSLSALNEGKKLLNEKYGDKEMEDQVYKAVLTGDSVWHIIAQVKLSQSELENDRYINRG